MSTTRIQQTELWKNAFADRAQDTFAEQRTRLSNALLVFRGNIQPLVRRIAEILPGLTIHDETHLDALWDTADLVAGPGYPLNPLEAFIFGGAVLLHDSAMCWEAYEHGQAGIRETIEWKDAYAEECDRNSHKDDLEEKSVADFAALRALHAHQAENLPNMTWSHPDTDQKIYLIEDTQLRIEFGRLIGRIAASHHWDIDTLASGLGDQFNAPSYLPSEWTIDPVKIACLLRCADASHVNDARAPLFLYALIKRQGVSMQHWRSQNRMMGPSLDASDPSQQTIVYTSSRPFKENEAAAWWVAHDAVSMINGELRTVNALLKNRERPAAPEFRIKRVKGADSLEELTRSIQVEGWKPCKAEPHVSNVESLVLELGGEKLYGSGSDPVAIVLRELVQNSRDAIVARRNIEPNFEGEINIRIEETDGNWLIIEDDGVGMSQRVLTGPLLDFGNSFWRSNLVKSEFPGLRSSRFRPIGRFGIGFYSIFMIADQAEVSSKGWDKGIADCNTLFFDSGASLRPILRQGRPNNFSSRISTRIRLKLKPGRLSGDHQITLKPSYLGAQSFHTPFNAFVSALAIGLDVKIFIDQKDGVRIKVHAGAPYYDPNPLQLLRSISFVDYNNNQTAATEISKQHQRLRPIRVDDRLYGVAAISTSNTSSQLLMSVRTIGGLATSLIGGSSGSYIGYIDHKPDSARRGPVSYEAPTETMSSWAIEQLQILDNASINERERCIAGMHACDFGADPIDFGLMLASIPGIGHKFLSYHEIAELCQDHLIGVFKSSFMDYIETHHSVGLAPECILIIPITNCSALKLEFTDGRPTNPNCIIGCIQRAIEKAGHKPIWTTLKTRHISNLTGEMELLCVASTIT